MDLEIKTNVPLSGLTTFNIGGPARYYAEIKDNKKLNEVRKFIEDKKIPLFVIGGGSDILVSDKGFNGLVIKLSDSFVNFKKSSSFTLVTASAGLNWDKFVKICVDNGLGGIECLSGIPGTVGASPVQNIGAYGQEVKDTISKVTVYDIKLGKFITFSKSDCKFLYRGSIFKSKKYRGRYVITEVTFRLRKAANIKLKYESLLNFFKERNIINPSLLQTRETILKLRSQKLEDPEIVPNAGSFFKNPVVGKKHLLKLKEIFLDIPSYVQPDGKYKIFAGWLIENAGWRGKSFGNAKVSDKHALILTNPNKKASAKEVKKLAEMIKNDIYKKFGIDIEPEVQYIGFEK